MKKQFTLAALGLLTAASFSAQAQIVVDGKVLPTEMGTGVGKYQELGTYSNPRGFGDWGLLKLYAATTTTKIYIFVAGTVQQKQAGVAGAPPTPEAGNSFQLYVNLPNLTGIEAPTGTGTSRVGTQLPLPTAGADGDPLTTFEKMDGTMDFEVDMAMAIHSPADVLETLIPSAVFYKGGAAASADAKVLGPNLNTTAGAPVTLAAGTTAAPFAALAGAQMAYQNSPDGKVTTNPGNFGWEIELDRAALGVAADAKTIQLFVFQNNQDGSYGSSDFIPQAVPALTTNSGNTAGTPDFTFISGDQFVTYTLATATSTGTSQADERKIGMSVYPNPATGVVKVEYNVLDKAQAVDIALFDLTGRKVKSLVNDKKNIGMHSADLSSADLAAGTYLVKVQVGGATSNRKLVIMK